MPCRTMSNTLEFTFSPKHPPVFRVCNTVFRTTTMMMMMLMMMMNDGD